MDNGLKNDYCEHVVILLFPNMAKTVEFDNKTVLQTSILKLKAGPGHIVTEEAMITKRDKFCERGFDSNGIA